MSSRLEFLKGQTWWYYCPPNNECWNTVFNVFVYICNLSFIRSSANQITYSEAVWALMSWSGFCLKIDLRHIYFNSLFRYQSPQSVFLSFEHFALTLQLRIGLLRFCLLFSYFMIIIGPESRQKGKKWEIHVCIDKARCALSHQKAVGTMVKKIERERKRDSGNKFS